MYLLKNATSGTQYCRLITSEFNYNLEYLGFLKELNLIYQSFKGSDRLLTLYPGNSSKSIIIDSEAYLLEYSGPSFEPGTSHETIEVELQKLGIEHFTSILIARSIVANKPIDLREIIENEIASVNQDTPFFIDFEDLEGNEQRIKIE
jgi:hypothetical protein